MRLGEGSVSRDYQEIARTLWGSITTGGLVAGVVATILQFLGHSGAPSAVAFVLILVLFLNNRIQRHVVYDYRRVMSVTTADKAQLMTELLRDHSADRGFALRTTDTELDFELVIIDHDVAFMLFHDAESASSVVNGALQVFDRAAIERLRGLFNAEWTRAESIKDGPVLSDDRRDQLIAEYDSLTASLPD